MLFQQRMVLKRNYQILSESPFCFCFLNQDPPLLIFLPFFSIKKNSELVRTTPPFKDYLNNLHTYAYLQNLEATDPASLQPRHNQIQQQYSSSTDEGCDTDHGG